jgi:hypothetical protein
MGFVVLYGGERGARHEQETCARLAREIAALKGYEFSGRFEPARRYPRRVYFVPSRTIALATARSIGIQTDDDLFGGVVPEPFVATKVITHPLVADDAAAPAGWSPQFARAAGEVVLAGYTAFTHEDALVAAERLLDEGPVRMKLPEGSAGRGQHVFRDRRELAELLAELEPAHLAATGIVLEQNLVEVQTYSVGQVRIDDLVASYVGTQRLTRDNAGQEVYGGTDLVIAQGGYDALLALELGAPEREAIAKARVYEAAAYAAYAGLFASRRNYDVARGRDVRGRERCGVLEQSWRVGGASGIELAALSAFHSDPRTIAVRASSHEIYGPNAAPPPHAKVYFAGEDDKVGHLLKYTVVDEYAGR